MLRSLRALALALVLGAAGTGAASAAQPSTPSDDYLGALHAADTFAWAWSQRDGRLGLTTLAPALRRRAGARDFFVGTSSPHHFAFEIGSGRRIDAQTYRFALKLFSSLAGGGLDQSPAPVALTLTHTAAGSWSVAALPALPP